MFHRCMLPCSKCATQASSTPLVNKRLISQSLSCPRMYRRSHYEVLGVPPSASHTEIREAFVKLSKEIHPDMNPNDPHNHNRFIQLKDAYSVLSKMNTRKEYDLGLAYMMRMTAASHSAGASFTPGSSLHTDSNDNIHQNDETFWDESIFYMRDKSKDHDRFYTPDSFYGIKGVRRRSNAAVGAIVCGTLMSSGVVYFFITWGWSRKKSRETVEKISRENVRLLKQVEERARTNQLDMFATNADRMKLEEAKMLAREAAHEAAAWAS